MVMNVATSCHDGVVVARSNVVSASCAEGAAVRCGHWQASLNVPRQGATLPVGTGGAAANDQLV